MNSPIDLTVLRKQANSAVVPLYWRLVDSIYATGQDPDLWPVLLEALAAMASSEETVSSSEAALTEHMEQALALNRYARLRSRSSTGNQRLLLSALAFPFLIVDRRGVVTFRGERFSQRRHTWADFQLSVDGQTGRVSTSSADLLGVVSGARSSAVMTQVGEKNQFRLVALALPHCDDAEKQGATLFAWFEDAAPASTQLRDLAALYGLTPAECSLLESVLAARSYSEIARDRGVTTNTVRSQIRGLLSKTGTHSKSELTQLVFCGPDLLNRLVGDRHQQYLYGAIESTRRAQTLALPGGEQLGFAEYGPEDGVPVLLMHNVSGSRLQIPVPEQRFYEQGVRLIVPDRFGAGLTDWPADHSRGAWVGAVEALLDYLEIPQVLLVGASVGSVFAMACAARAPHRIKRLALVSPMSPLIGEQDGAYMNPDILNLIQLGQRSPEMLRKLVGFASRGTPTAYIDRIIEGLPRCDQELYTNTGFYEMSVNALRENVRRGIEPVVNDFLELSDPWLNDYCGSRKIQVEMHCWQGTLDITAPLPAVRRLCEVFSDSRLTVLPGETHMLIYRHWNTILSHLVNPELNMDLLGGSAG